jgi:hypothetical protein
MATQERTTRHGWVRCPNPACGQQFLRNHVCRAPRGEVVDRRPVGFEQTVEEARAQARADRVVQLELTDLPASCSSCHRGDVALGDDGVCVPCMAAAAVEAAAAVVEDESPPRAPP